jgi:L-ascorbate metabolism protein UlaG (beta-lactamase superfamily)
MSGVTQTGGFLRRTSMKIKWVGHACFALTASDGKIVLTDPYEAGGYDGKVGYKRIAVKPDAVTVSHQHEDHNHVKGVTGKPVIVDATGEHRMGSFAITGFSTHHDPSGGSERGGNIIFRFKTDGVTVAHCGDLGHELTPAQIKELGQVDVLLVPIGGFFTIDASQAWNVVNAVKPKVVIPMHFKTDAIKFPIGGVDKFTAGKKNVRNVNGTEVDISKEALPARQEIWVLDYEK